MTEEKEIKSIFKTILRKAGIKFRSINWAPSLNWTHSLREFGYAHANICIGDNCYTGVNFSSTLKMWRSIRPCDFMIDLREPDSFSRAVRTLKNCFGKANDENQHTDRHCERCEFKPKCMACGEVINARQGYVNCDGYTNCEECGNQHVCKDFDCRAHSEYSGHIPHVHWTCGKCKNDTSCWEG